MSDFKDPVVTRQGLYEKIEQQAAEIARLKGDRDALSALLDDELYIRELVALWDRQALN